MLGSEDKVARGVRRFAWCVAMLALTGGSLAGCAKDPEGDADRNTGGASNAGVSGTPTAGTGAPLAGGSAPSTAGTGSSTPPAGGSGAGAAGTGSAGTGTAGTMAQAGSGAGGSSSGDAVDCSALPLPTNTDDIVSTFEDGTGNVMQVAGRGGGFYMFNDGTGMQTPATGGLPDATAVDRCGSMYAMCMSGSGFTIWGAGMGTDLGPTSTDAAMTKMPWDASAYTGISFWAKANPGSAVALRVSMKDANTAPEGGNCDTTVDSGAEACNDDWGRNLNLTTEWAPYTILYSDLAQSNWGKQFTAFDSANVYSIQFQVNKGLDFDLCIDDLAFVR